MLVHDDLPWPPPGSTARLVSETLPPPELVSTAFVLAFDSGALLMPRVRARATAR